MTLTPETARELVEAAKAMSMKIDEINAHPSFVGMFQMAKIHGTEYTGPDWVKEIQTLRAAIERAEKEMGGK